MKWKLTISFFQYFIPIVLIVIIISTILFEIRNDIEIQLIKDREKDNIQLVKKSLENEFDTIISDLMLIAESEQVTHFMSTKNKKDYKLISNKFESICRWTKIYDQIRIIDLSGNELIRVNKENGDCNLVKINNLQNKADRYYFKETIKIPKHEVYISSFDLNIEHGKIEYPLKPMIRFCTPVYDNTGVKQGIAVVNYRGNEVLSRIKTLADGSVGEISLLNNQGYWLISPNTADEWGFMFAEGINKKFQNLFPDSWANISKEISGQFENGNGIFTFQKVEFMEKLKHDIDIAGEPRQLSIVSRILPQTIQANSFSMFMDFIIFNIYILLLIVVVSFIMAGAKVRKKMHEESIKEKERLQGVLEMAGAVSHEINQPLQIISTYSDLLAHMDRKDSVKIINKISDQVKRIGIISNKLSKITTYKTRDYMKGVKIIDIDKSSDIKD